MYSFNAVLSISVTGQPWAQGKFLIPFFSVGRKKFLFTLCTCGQRFYRRAVTSVNVIIVRPTDAHITWLDSIFSIISAHCSIYLISDSDCIIL